ncbi:MAG: hypothetical protein IPP83_18045 [Flavobacteriales bacterium]|nr:hypothetical protein [Flavobacteriales bacterium]
MTALELRSQLKQLIDDTDDQGLLEWVKTILSNSKESRGQAQDMLRVARLSDEDIAAGRTHTMDEVRRWMAEQKRNA